MRALRKSAATVAIVCGAALAALPAMAQTMSNDYDVALQMFAIPSQYNNTYSTQNYAIVELPGFPAIDPYSIPATNTSKPNGLFNASEYGANCGTGIYIVNDPGGKEIRGTSYPFPITGYTPARAMRACKVTTAPIVDASFLSQLSANGWIYTLVFPKTNNGNNRGYVVWSSDQNRYLGSERMHTGVWFPQYVGYARIKGVSWMDQFQSKQVCPAGQYNIYTYACKVTPVTIPSGDGAGDFLNGLSSSLRATTIRLAAPARLQSIGVTIAASYDTILVDDWLNETDPPPPPPPPPKIDFPVIPPYAGVGNPGAVNIGTVSDGAAAGSATTGSFGSTNPLPFDYAAFCNSPSKDGSPRSPLWMQNCLKKQQ